MKRLFLLDGMALIYRAHFALIQSPIRNSKGMNTSALYGFLNTLLSILDKGQPTHLGVAFDTSAPTARHTLFPAYKAQRDAMPEELAQAIPHVKHLCRAFHLPVLELDGYEADDIIGTLVKRADTAGFESFMVTPDKDFAQLLSPTTYMWRPGRKGDEHEVITLAKLPEIWGVNHPDQITDLLGLMGDSSDNIPGVPGIGPKTAQKLIAEFGSIEQLLASTSLLKGSQKERIETHSDQALLSKSLATINLEVPIEVSWDDLELVPRDDQAVRKLLAEFEFRTLHRRIYGHAPEPSPAPNQPSSSDTATPDLFAAAESPPSTLRRLAEVPHRYHVADTDASRQLLFTQLHGLSSFCFDIETTSLNRHQAELIGVAFCWKAHEAWFLPVTATDPWMAELKAVLLTAAEKVGHNLKYDLAILSRLGVEVTGPYFDTMLVDALLHPDRRHSMDDLAKSLLHYEPIALKALASQFPATPAPPPPSQAADLFELAAATTPASAKPAKSNEIDMNAIPLAALAEYAAEDADVTWQLAELLRKDLAASGQSRVWSDIEQPLLPVLIRMEMAGISLDSHALRAVGLDLQTQIDSLAASIHQRAGKPFNIASPRQLGEILFDHLNLADKAKKTKTGQFKTDEATLQAMEGKHPIIAEILSWREATKLKSTYLDALPRHVEPTTGRIHTHFHQLVAATGRLASSDPNLQNIPVRSALGRQIRRAFVPNPDPPGAFVILSCDYSQIELRIMAALANDATMIEAFRNGADIHTITAAKVFVVDPAEVTSDMRRTAKMVNFGIIYGISAFGLSQRLNIPRGEAAAIIDAYFREYPAIREFMDRSVETARSKGYAETLTGRRRNLPELQSANQSLRANAERAAINTPIQGTAADMIKLAMIHTDALLSQRACHTRMLLQVHDELVFDLAVTEQETLVPEILQVMRTALPLPNQVPIEVESGTGPHWLAAH